MFSASGAESTALPSAPVTRTMNGPIPAAADGSLNDHFPSGPVIAVPMTLPSAPIICTVAPGAAVPVKSMGWPTATFAPAAGPRKAGLTAAGAAAMFNASGAESMALPSAPVTRTMNGPIPAAADGSLNDHFPSGPVIAVPMTLPSAPIICTVAPGAAVPVKSMGWPTATFAPAAGPRKAGLTAAGAAAMFNASGAESMALPSAPVTRTMNGPIPAAADGSLNDHFPSGPVIAVPMTLPSAPMICTVAPGAAVPVKSIG